MLSLSAEKEIHKAGEADTHLSMVSRYVECSPCSPVKSREPPVCSLSLDGLELCQVATAHSVYILRGCTTIGLFSFHHLLSCPWHTRAWKKLYAY